jgi:CSLREA domain-containing protein
MHNETRTASLRDRPEVSGINHRRHSGWRRGTAGLAALLGVIVMLAAATAQATTVTSLNDDTTDTSYCTLRGAINLANGATDSSLIGGCTAGTNGAAVINFDSSLGTATIDLSGPLPPVTGSVTINGGGTIAVSDNDPSPLPDLSAAADFDLDEELAISDSDPPQVMTVNTGASLELDNLTIEDSNAVFNAGTLTVDNCTFSNNSSGIFGGAIYNSGGTLTVTGSSTFSGNTAFYLGGAIFNTGTLNVDGSTNFTANSANSGGAISNVNGTVIVTGSSFSNSKAYSGGAILNLGAGTATITASTFSGNSAGAEGGAIFNNGGKLTVTISTFSGNSASYTSGSAIYGNGGAIMNLGSGATTAITASTFSGNSVGAQGAGGAIYDSAGTVNIESTILAASTNGDCAISTAAGTAINDAGYNISDDSSCNFTVGGTSTVVATTALGLDPNGLTDNGGPTQTIALESTSPAIDVIPQADCTTEDQRGDARPDSAETSCDVGAYEFQDAPPPPTFAGTVGKANCHGQSVSALAKQYKGMDAAAAGLGYPSVQDLQNAIWTYCNG